MEYFVTGTDTGVGKTLVCAGLCLKLGASYWKPFQTGEDKDYNFIKKYLPESQVHASLYDLPLPLSPNQAAEQAGLQIDLENLQKPRCKNLIIEGVGGCLVPLNKKQLLIDFMQVLACPILLVASSELGTLNHTLLSVEALKSRGLNLVGILLSGPLSPKNKRDIEYYTQVPVLLEIPPLPSLEASLLKSCFSKLNLDKSLKI